MHFIEAIDLKNNIVTKLEKPDLISSKDYHPSPDLVEVFHKKNDVCVFANHQNKLFYMDKDSFNRYIKKSPSEIPKFLVDSGLFVNKKVRIKNQIKKYCNIAIAFGLTDDCNLSCKYCSQDSGKKVVMPIEMAQNLIDTVTSKWKHFSLYFVGGGEQTLELKNLKKIVAYGRSINPKTSVSITTNGIFSNNIRYWLLKNINHINISCDGPPSIQNKQRPLKNGQPSSKYVEDSIKFFIERNKSIKIKSVIHKKSMKNLYKIMNYYYSLGVKSIDFINLEERGRIWKVTKPLTPKEDVLFHLMAKEIGDELGVNISIPYLNLNLDDIWPFGCPTKFFHFSTDASGNLCICPQTSLRSNPYEFRLLTIGKYDNKKGNFLIDEPRLNYLRNAVINLKKCKSCKYNFICIKCLLKCAEIGKNFDKPNEDQCQSIKNSLLLYSKSMLDKNIFRITPYLLEKDNRLFFKMFFNKLELKPYGNGGIEGSSILKIRISDIDKISKDILNYKKEQEEITLFLLSFLFEKNDLNKKSGKKIENFLDHLRKNKIYFKVMKPLPRCIFDDNYNEISIKFNIPSSCFECLQLFKVCGNDVKICNQKENIKIKIEDVRDRKEIFDLFKKNNRKLYKNCEKCIYLIRNMCNGICQDEILSNDNDKKSH